MKKVLFYWLFSVCIISFVCLICYSVEQQLNRQSANDLPVQETQDAVYALDNGASPDSLISGKVDLTHSLSPFLIIYDKSKNSIASSASLDGSIPSLPTGMLDNVPDSGDSRITWQPKTGLRFATVIRHYSNGYVVSGRSLYETELRIDNIGMLILVAWIAGFIGFFILLLILGKIFGFFENGNEKTHIAQQS